LICSVCFAALLAAAFKTMSEPTLPTMAAVEEHGSLQVILKVKIHKLNISDLSQRYSSTFVGSFLASQHGEILFNNQTKITRFAILFLSIIFPTDGKLFDCYFGRN
jgi:hypothetical protein